MYTWEVLKCNECEDLLDLAVKKASPKYFSDHWLTTGEIFQLIGMDKYGKLKRSSRDERSKVW